MNERNLKKAKLTVLGCGTSTGVPIPGCTCHVCTSKNPRNHRLRTSSAITLPDDQVLLIDASPDLRLQALTHGLRRVDAVLYTHAHADHILGTDDLRVFNFRRTSPIPCISTRATLESLKQTFHYIFDPDPLYQGGALAKLSLEEVSPGVPFEAAGQSILPLLLYHGELPILGWRIGDLAYATDCNCIPAETKEQLKGVRTLLLDGLRYEPHATHFTIPEAVETAQTLGFEQTYLLHMTHTVEYEDVSKSLPEGIQLAYDGLEIEFSA